MMVMQMEHPVIIFDCDEVLLDYTPGFVRYVTDVLKLDVDPKGPTQFYFGPWLGTDDMAMVMDIFERFSQSDGFGQLEPLVGAVDGVLELKKLGYSLQVMTSCTSDPAVMTARKLNLARVFGLNVFADVLCLPLGASKLEALKLKPQALFVDDRPDNVSEALQAGHLGIVMSAFHNIKDRHLDRWSHLEWIDNWPDLLSRIISPAMREVPTMEGVN